MPKKIKPIEMTDSAMPSKRSKTDSETQTVREDAVESDVILDSAPIMTKTNFDQQLGEKLDSIKKLEENNVRLTRENDELQKKLAEYISELSELRSSKAVVSEPGVGDEMTELRKANSELQDENDRYLMRISELTFENAKLIAKERDTAKHQPVKAAPQTSSAKRPVYRQYIPTSVYSNIYRNGYSDWN